MHGIIFFALRQFAEKELGSDAWTRLHDHLGTHPKSFLPTEAYPDADAVALIQAASAVAKKPPQELLEAFGEFLGPELLMLNTSLVNPDWRTLEVIENVETAIHTVIRMKDPNAKPPVLRVQRLSETSVQLVYSSERRLCSIAKGMARGLARHFGERLEIREESCMHDGAPFCSIVFEETASSQVAPTLVGNLQASGSAPASGSGPTSGSGSGSGSGARRSGPWDQIAAASGSGSVDPRYGFLSPPEAPGEMGRLGPYRVRKLLGRGAMGMVFLADDPSLQRQVAIKVMSPETAAQSSARGRFLREARSLAAVEHQMIIPIYHVGEENGVPFLVMPALKGMTLEDFLKRDRPTLQQSSWIGRQVAAGLDAAHSRQLIHRDVKPANIWLTPPKGYVKILDFGLSRSLLEETDLTQAGTVLGTPMYMAPEQAQGLAADTRSDLYSLGAVLYRLFGGQTIFNETNVYTLLSSVISESPKPLREVNPDVPHEVSELVMSLLAKDPARRPDSARFVYHSLCEHRALAA